MLARPYTTLMKNEPAGKRPAGGWLGPRPVPEGLLRSRAISGSRPAVEVYGWQVREKPLSIKIPIDIVERLQEDILYGLGMRTPCDVMGLLIGRVAKEYSSTITIHDYVLAGYTSDAVGSRLWSDERLADMIKPWSKATSATYVVGFFRSQSEDWPEITKEDLKGAKRLLRRTPNVFLLIRSGLSRSYAGRLFLRPSRPARLDEEYGEFPLNAGILRAQWDATDSKCEASGLHFIAGNPLQGKERPEPPRYIQEIVDAVFEPMAPSSDDSIIKTPIQPAASQIVEMQPHESAEAADAPKRSLWAKLFRRASEETLHLEPVALSITRGAPAAEPAEALQSEVAAELPATEEAPSVEPVAAASGVEIPDGPTAPVKPGLWARLFRRTVEEAQSIEPVVVNNALDLPSTESGEALQSEIAHQETPRVEPIAAASNVEIPDVAAEPAQQSLFAKVFRPTTEEAPHVEPVTLNNPWNTPWTEAADAPSTEEAREEPAEALESEVAEEPVKQSLWARLFGPAPEQFPHVEPIAANNTEDTAWAEAADAPSMEEAWEDPAAAFQSDVETEPAERSLWAKLFRPATEHPPRVEPASASGRLDFGSGSIAEEPLQSAAFADNPPPPPPSRHSWLGVAATWTIAVGLTMWCMSGRGPFSQRRPEARETETRPAVIANPIGLQVDSAGGLLEIAWDPISVAAMTSSGGFLTIRDGNVLKEVRLDSGEIRSGHLYYGPRNTDLGIRLEVARNDGAMASESIRVVGPPPRGRLSVK